jgi:hypothetical protein
MSRPGDPERTVAFSVAPYLVVLEGASNTLSLILSKLYGDSTLPRDAWSVSHFAANRREFIEQLRAAGSEHRRIGISAHSQSTVDLVKRHADELKVRCSVMNHH